MAALEPFHYAFVFTLFVLNFFAISKLTSYVGEGNLAGQSVYTALSMCCMIFIVF